MIDLRPIGTEFEVDHGVDESSTDPRGRVFKYRIVDHKPVTRFVGDREKIMVEVVEAISTRYYNVGLSKIILDTMIHR